MADLGTIGSGSLEGRSAVTSTSNPVGKVDLLGGRMYLQGGASKNGSGTVKINNVGVVRTVRAYRRVDGLLLGQTTSAADGTFSIDCGDAGPVICMAFDILTGAPDYNAKIFDYITPV